jgi:hypothetical protein
MSRSTAPRPTPDSQLVLGSPPAVRSSRRATRRRPRATHGIPRNGAARESGARSRLPVSVVAIIAATGVFVVAIAYTTMRLGYLSSQRADAVYWLGQALIAVPVAFRLIAPRDIGDSGTAILVVVLTEAEYLLKICYSPLMFTYVDELEHWRSAVNLLHTGKLFTVNYLLPISPHYPGLEEATSSVASVTGLPIFASGLIVAGTAHLLFVCLLYLIFRHISRSHRIAGIAVLVYSSNPDLPSFDSMFAYQTIAVAFLGLALLAAWRFSTPETAGTRGGWLTIAVLAVVATAITHHVTSYVLIVTLILVTAASLLTGACRPAARLGALTLVSAVAATGWAVFAAHGIVGYLAPVADGVIRSSRALLGGGHSAAPPTSAGPLGDRMLAAVAVLTLSALLPVGWWQVWRRYRRQTWFVAAMIGSLSWYALIMVRLLVADGSELAGRAATYVYAPTAFIIAVVLVHLVRARLRWQPVAVTAVGCVLVVLFDGLANGWPPYWERLPGPYQVAGVERSVEPEELTAANWTLAALGPGNRFAADFGSYPILGSHGDQNPVYNDAYLYASPRYTRSDALRVQAEAIGYILVDRRLSRSLPASGSYFPGTARAGLNARPLALAGLTKFNRIPGVGRLYDSGNIVIYDLERSEYYAP